MADDQDKQLQNQSQKNKHLSILTGTSNDKEKICSRHLWK